jgi:hypothetical protein
MIPAHKCLHSRLCRCMSPQKLFFCYHLPTRGRAGVKLGDAWYVSNVSIIFDAPCLFIHHLRTVLLHFVALLCIFRNYPINKSKQCQFPIFCCFCVSEVIHRKYSQNWTKQVPEVLFFLEASRDPKRSRRGATKAPHTRAAQPGAWPRPLCVRAPQATSDNAPSPIKTPLWKKT